MKRVLNFGAGPATLPLAVLEQIQADLFDWRGLGVSIMELGHRTQAFRDLVDEVNLRMRELLAIPDDYALLFLAGGARVQFAMLALNLLGEANVADYVDTGVWSKIAHQEAQRYADARISASAADSAYTLIPDLADWQLSEQAAYLHYTDNETIQGLEFHAVPEITDRPLVTDMTSSLLSKPLDIKRFGLIYAGAQKNLGIAGLTIAIIRRDLLDRARATTPTVFNYQVNAEQHSLYATPPTFAWYVTGLVCDWIASQGGVAALAQLNQQKADLLYQYIDQSDFYHNPIDASCRSRMNVVFTLRESRGEALFLQEASQAGLAYLKGHRVVGGMRASIYNAMPLSAVQQLLVFMQDFAARHG